jgi:hypothetical protein
MLCCRRKLKAITFFQTVTQPLGRGERSVVCVYKEGQPRTKQRPAWPGKTGSLNAHVSCFELTAFYTLRVLETFGKDSLLEYFLYPHPCLQWKDALVQGGM